MSDESAKPATVTVPVTYVLRDDLAPAHVDAAFGGRTPSGMLGFALYAEHGLSPTRQELRITEGVQVETVDLEERIGIERRVCGRFVTTPEAAYQLGEWLMQTAQGIMQEGGEPDGQ